MKDTTIATVRTAVNQSWLVAIVAMLNVLGVDVREADLAPFLVAAPVVITFWYRVSLLLAERWDWIGFLLFGSRTPPRYDS